MKFIWSIKLIRVFTLIVLLTTSLTLFFYIHEQLPQQIRAITAILCAPVAISSGLFYYFNFEIYVYNSLFAIIISNFFFSILFIILFGKYLNLKSKHK